MGRGEEGRKRREGIEAPHCSDSDPGTENFTNLTLGGEGKEWKGRGFQGGRRVHTGTSFVQFEPCL